MRLGKKTMWLSLAVALSVVVAAGAAGPREDGEWGGWGADDHPRMEQFHERRLERMADVLDLSAQQIEQWQEIFASRNVKREAEGSEIHALHEQIRALASADDPDVTAIGERVIEAHRLMEAAQAEREALHAELMSILTPEQKERFEVLQELRPERGEFGHRGRRGRRPRP